jgi:hypothetical protein
MIFKARRAEDWRGQARRGWERLHVTQYGNWDNFSGRGRARYGKAGPGRAWTGKTWTGKAIRLPVGGITGHFR